MWLISLCLIRSFDVYGQRHVSSSRFNQAKRCNRALLIGMVFLAGALIAFTSLPFRSSAADSSSLYPLQGEIGRLEPKIPVERELAGGQTHSYRVLLKAGQFVQVIADQKGIDVAMTLFNPDKAKLTEIILPHMLLGRKVIIAVIEQSGSHQLEVRSQNKDVAAGRYEVQIADLRDATQRDRSFIAGNRAVVAATSLKELGTVEALQGSIKKFEQAIPFFREVGDSNAEADTLVNIAAVYERLSDNQSALDYYNKALALHRAHNNRSGEALTLNNIGSAYAQLGDNQKALGFYNQALPLFRAENNRSGQAFALNGIGYAYIYLSDYRKALESLNHALTLSRALGDRRGEAAATQNIGFAYYYQDQYRKALESLNHALSLSRSASDQSVEASVLYLIGLVYYHLGEHQKALDFYTQGLSLYRAIVDRRGEATTLRGIGQVYRLLGENQKALDFFDQGLSISRAIGRNRYGEASALNNIAEVYILMGGYQKALDLYKQSLQICLQIGNRSGEASNLNGIGAAHAGLGDYQKALDFYGQALPILRAIGNRRREGYTLSQIGHAYLLSSEYQKALTNLNDALTLFRAVSARTRESHALYLIARVYQARDDLVLARSHSEAAIGLAETFRHEFSSQQLRSSYLATVQDYYELNIDLLMQLRRQRPSEGIEAVALETSERARARSLLDLLGEAGVDIRQGVEPALLGQERSLQQRINSQSERQTQLLSGKPTPEQVTTAAREIEATIAEYQDVQTKIRAASPRYAALTQPEPLSLKEIQQQVLDADTLLLEYALGDKRSYVWAVTQTSISGYELPGREEIETTARQFYNLVKDNSKSEEATQSAARLSQMLLAPLAEKLKTKRLVIVTDGALQYVPFGALPTPEGGSGGGGEVGIRRGGEAGSRGVGGEGRKANRNSTHPSAPPPLRPSSPTPLRPAYRPLILDHEIVNLPSASTLAVLRREIKGRAPAPKLLAVLADPVFDINDVRLRRSTKDITGKQKPTDSEVNAKLLRSAKETGLANGEWPLPRLLGTRREATAILGLVPEAKRKRALDFEANREVATGGDLDQYQIVHFATHGVLNSQHPELSGIVLSLFDGQGRAQDGFLRLHEIYNLRLPVELIVLSACQTGLGKEIRGEGLVGLTRGFMYAGTPRLVTSLWQVDDQATSELMKRFYSRMLKGKMTPAAALRAAQMEMWKQKDWQSPYYWAAFTLQGEWR